MLEGQMTADGAGVGKHRRPPSPGQGPTDHLPALRFRLHAMRPPGILRITASMFKLSAGGFLVPDTLKTPRGSLLHPSIPCICPPSSRLSGALTPSYHPLQRHIGLGLPPAGSHAVPDWRSPTSFFDLIPLLNMSPAHVWPDTQ